MSVNNKKTDYIPIKCEGWNGKFKHEPGASADISIGAKIRRHNHAVTDPRNFFSFQEKVPANPRKLSGIGPENVPAVEQVIMPPLQWETASQFDQDEIRSVIIEHH